MSNEIPRDSTPLALCVGKFAVGGVKEGTAEKFN